MQENSFTLTRSNPFKVFALKDAHSVIDIYQVFINVLMDKPRTEWQIGMSELDLFLEFSDPVNQVVDEQVDLSKYLSTHQSVPVLEICGLQVPKNHQTGADIKIEMKSHKRILPENLRAEIKCMISEGVSER